MFRKENRDIFSAFGNTLHATTIRKNDFQNSRHWSRQERRCATAQREWLVTGMFRNKQSNRRQIDFCLMVVGKTEILTG
jgi:hypothetical protein